MGEADLIGPDPVLESMYKVQLSRHILKIDQSIQKSYTVVIIKELELQVDDLFFLNVSLVRDDVVRQERKAHP